MKQNTSKFKVGDKVFVVENIRTMEKAPCGLMPEMRELCGCVGKIRRVWNDGDDVFYKVDFDPNDYWWDDTLLRRCGAKFV